MAGQGVVDRLLLVPTGNPVVIGPGVDRHRVPHHSRRHGVRQADVDGADRPGMAQVIGG